MNVTYTTKDILNMEAGEEMDHVVHRLLDRGQEYHWLHIPEYSTDKFMTLAMIEELRERWKFFNISTNMEGYRVEYNFTTLEGKDFSEMVCKAFIVGSIQ